jgi:hypothetical protein
MDLPKGLCPDRQDHAPHVQHSETLGNFWCEADESKRLPYAAERRRSGQPGNEEAEHAGLIECGRYDSAS